MSRASRTRAKLDPRFIFWKLRIRRSPIHRLGVFAEEDIPIRRKVVEYTGERITQKETVMRFNRILQTGKRNRQFYWFHLNSRWVIDGAVGGSGAELINHSCDPNLRTRRIRGHILYVSRRKISKGEELTVDYRFPKTSIRVRCHCGSPKCRGFLNRL